jgi:hypothetical protein
MECPTENFLGNDFWTESKTSRLNQKHQDKIVILEWCKDGMWRPRLLIKHSDASVLETATGAFQDFTNSLELVKDLDSIFSPELIVCRVTRDEKRTLAGNVLKVTGPPRFEIVGAPPPAVIQTLESLEAVWHVLQKEFTILLDKMEGLDLTKSLGTDPTVWSTT